jgi:amidase
LRISGKKGAVLVDNLEKSNVTAILDYNQSSEELALVAEFKVALNEYLSQLTLSPVRSLADVISFSEEHKKEVLTIRKICIQFVRFLH